MVDKITIGVLGCANVALRSVIPSILELNGQFKLIGIASRSIEKAQKYEACFQTNIYEGYQKLIDNSELQAVYIPLPNALHSIWIEKALGRDLHVLVEKSMACEFNEVLKLNELAKQKNLALVENFQFRFHNQLSFIKELLKNGSIGELRCLRSSFGFPSLLNQDDIRYKKDLGGGALLDAGAYPLKIAQIFLGDNIEVKASNLNFSSGKDVDIWGGAYVKQIEGNLFGEIAFGFDHFYQCNLELWGSLGKLYTNRIFTANFKYEPEIILESNYGKEIISLPADNHFKKMLMHFHDLIATRKGLEEEYQQNINQARLIEEIRQKANE